MPLVKPPRAAAFTLVELLATLAIVAILGALVIVGVGRVKERGQILTCSTNLRQTGVAMLLYAQDNRSSLPGPLWRGQSPYFQADAQGSFDRTNGNLANFIAPYLNVPAPQPGQSGRVEPLTCPAWLEQDETESKSICYYSTGPVTLEDGTQLFPFGRASANPASAVPPLRLAMLSNVAANTPALREFDRREVSDGFYFTDPRVPLAPVHEKLRHVLYFDGHIGTQGVAL